MISKVAEDLLKEIEQYAGDNPTKWQRFHERFLRTYKATYEWTGYDYMVAWLNAKTHLWKALQSKEKTAFVQADVNAYSTIEAHYRSMLVEHESKGDFPPLADKDVMDKILRWKDKQQKYQTLSEIPDGG